MWLSLGIFGISRFFLLSQINVPLLYFLEKEERKNLMARFFIVL